MSMPTETNPRSGDDGQLRIRLSVWRTAPLDTIVLFGVLLAANWFLDHSDPGWLRLNPTPWLLLPLFLGGRYGVGAGLTGALVAVCGILALQWSAGNHAPLGLIQGKPFFFLSLLGAGGAGAIVHSLVAGPVEQLHSRYLALSERTARLEEDVALARANEAGLQQALLLHGAEAIGLSSELKRLFSGEQGRFEDALLRLLEDEFGVISAAIYRDDTGRRAAFPRVAATDADEAGFPAQVPSPEAPLAEAARDSGQVATWQALWDEKPSSEAPPARHLAAIPWQWSPIDSSGPRALLLIGRMRFEQINWETLDRVAAVFAWCMARFEPAALDQTRPTRSAARILPPPDFANRLEEARDLESRLNLPAKLIVFSADPKAPPPLLSEFVEKLKVLASPLDLIGAIGDGKNAAYSIGLLTTAPSASIAEQTARQLLARIGQSSRAVRYDVIALTDSLPTSKPSGNEPAPALEERIPSRV